MFRLIDRDDRRGLAANVVLFVGSALAVNGIVFGCGLVHDRPSTTFTLPGPLVGTLWVLLFASLGVARWLIARAARGIDYRATWYVAGFAAFCLSYVFYALPFDAPMVALVGNLATIAAAFVVIVRIPHRLRRAAWFVMPVPTWVAVATVSVLGLPGV